MYRLSPEANFIEGFGRTIDFDGNLHQYNYSESPKEADARALFSDFLVVGNDFIDFLENNYSHVETQESE